MNIGHGIALFAFAGVALMQVASAAPDNCAPASAAALAQAKRSGESPLACDRSALSEAERTRHFDELGPRLRSLRKSVRELSDGYAFEYPGDRATYKLLTEWADGERVCCPFFDIAVKAEREGGSVWVTVTGRKGVKDFIASEGAEWVKR